MKSLFTGVNLCKGTIACILIFTPILYLWYRLKRQKMIDAEKYRKMATLMADVNSRLSAALKHNYTSLELKFNEIKLDRLGFKHVLHAEHAPENSFLIKTYRVYPYQGVNNTDAVVHLPNADIIVTEKGGYAFANKAKSITDNFADEYLKVLDAEPTSL